MKMNGVEMLDMSSSSAATYIPTVAVESSMVTQEESSTVEPAVTAAQTDDGVPTEEAKTQHDMEALRAQLQHQLEYYFSSENLNQDPYLLSQMDDQRYVPIWTIANFNQVKKLTSDIDLITSVLKASSLVQVDDKNEKVRPMQTKYALILREIPEDTPVESVEALFSGDECPKFLSCEFAANTSWYVSFETESDAQAAYRHLREKVKTFLGKPIRARIKSKTHHLNMYSNPKLNIQQQPNQQHTPVPPQIVSPPFEYIQSPINAFAPAQPGAQYGTTPTGQQPPFIAAIATQPPGSNSPHTSSVSTTAINNASAHHVFVMPSGQPWPPSLYPTSEPMQHTYGNPPFTNAVFPVSAQAIAPSSVAFMNQGKSNAMFPNKPNNYQVAHANTNYITSDPNTIRNMQQDSHGIVVEQFHPSPEARHHYLPAVSQGSLPVKVVHHPGVAGQQQVYQRNQIYSHFKQPITHHKPMNKPGNATLANGMGGRYGRNQNSYPHSYSSPSQNNVSEISPRFQQMKKGGNQASHQHQRYSTSRNQTHDSTNRNPTGGTDGTPQYQNGPTTLGGSNQEHFIGHNASYMRHNSTGNYDPPMMNGGRLGQRHSYSGKFNTDTVDGSSGAYNVGDVNNNVAKRHSYNDTMQSSGYPDLNYKGVNDENVRRNQSLQQQRRRPRRTGSDLRSNPTRPSPPANGPSSPEQSFNLETNAFPPLPGAASNASTVLSATSTDASVKKSQVPEESYKNSLKMNLDKVTSSVSPSTPSVVTVPAPVRNYPPPPVKDESMQSNSAGQPPDKPAPGEREAPVAPTHVNPVAKNPVKTLNRAQEPPKHHPANTPNEDNQASSEKIPKQAPKPARTNKQTVENAKPKPEPAKAANREKPAVAPATGSDSAETDNSKKPMTYAEMLRKKTTKPTTSTVSSDENDNHIDAKPETSEEHVAPAPHPNKVAEKGTHVSVNNKHENKSPSPTEDSENGDEKAWESAGPTKRGHRGDRTPVDHSQHNGYDTRDGGYQRGGRNGNYWRGGMRGKGRNRSGHGGRGGRYNNGYNGTNRDRYGSNGNDRSSVSSDAPSRKR